MTTNTLVAKMLVGGLSRLLWDWAASQVVVGAGACAVIDLPNGDTYVAVRMAKAARTEYAAASTKASIEQLPGSPQVDWVRPLTRRLQRLFGWGDAGATSADVARAVAGADVEELAVLVPQAADMIMRNAVDWKHLPALHSVSQGAPIAGLAIEDRSARLALQDRADIEEEDDTIIPLRVVHEAFDQHVWSERTNRKVQCERCEGWDPYECDCGARLCGLCRLPPTVGTKTTCKWQQHPPRPLPFSVQDHVKWPDEEKLAWIRQELGEGAELEDFAKKWHALFGDKIRGEVPQKAACIKLYGMYAPPEEGRAWRNESDLPPETLEPFQRVWNVDAPERCRECSKPSEVAHPVRRLGTPYCSPECAHAGLAVVCKECGAKVNPAWAGCSTCKWGLWGYSEPPPPLRWHETDIMEMTEAQRDRLAWWKEIAWRWDKRAEVACKMNVDMYCEVACLHDHQPAWKRRRRS